MLAAACLIVGGVSLKRSPVAQARPADIELCVQAGTRELIVAGPAGCAPVDRPRRRPRHPAPQGVPRNGGIILI